MKALAGATLAIEIDRDELDLALPLGRELVPRGQLLRAWLAPRRTEREHLPALDVLDAKRLAGRVDRSVELDESISHFELIGMGDSGQDQEQSEGAHAGWTNDPAHRFTASSSSIHISMYLGCIGPSYLRSVK